MKIIMAILMFLILGALFIVSNENLALKVSGNIDTFTDMYYEWIASLFENTKSLTGYIINSNWLPDTR